VIVECVPNFSEGRRTEVVEAIRNAIGPGVLDVTMDADHHRSVITYAGSPEAMVEAGVRAGEAAAKLIDMRCHRGEHPRVGALDVLPFVPVEGMTLKQCADLAARTGEQIWKRHQIPVYLYEAAARTPERRNLAELRRRIAAGEPPDIGQGKHETAGVTVVGARKFLIAFNVNLQSQNLEAASSIAHVVRESSGGLPSVRALGIPLASRGIVQVSMNLTDFEITSIEQAYVAVERQAVMLGIEILESQLIGLAPRAALNEQIAGRVKLTGFHEGLILEERLKR